MQTPYALDLRDLMDNYYGPGAWTQRIGIGIGTDIGPALTVGLRTLRSQFGRGKILIPPGLWLMITSPTPADLSGHKIEGIGSQASKIVYSGTSGVAFSFSGFTAFTGGGMKGLGILLEAGLGDTNAIAIALTGNATFQQDQTEWDDLYIDSVGASSFWWDGFHADGSARSSPQGIRIATLNNVQVFNTHNVPFYLSNIVGWTLNNVGAFTGKGPYANTVIINGGSTEVHGQGIWANLNVTNTTNVLLNGTKYS